jgi:hypothetical protein
MKCPYLILGILFIPSTTMAEETSYDKYRREKQAYDDRLGLTGDPLNNKGPFYPKKTSYLKDPHAPDAETKEDQARTQGSDKFSEKIKEYDRLVRGERISKKGEVSDGEKKEDQTRARARESFSERLNRLAREETAMQNSAVDTVRKSEQKRSIETINNTWKKPK